MDVSLRPRVYPLFLAAITMSVSDSLTMPRFTGTIQHLGNDPFMAVLERLAQDTANPVQRMLLEALKALTLAIYHLMTASNTRFSGAAGTPGVFYCELESLSQLRKALRREVPMVVRFLPGTLPVCTRHEKIKFLLEHTDFSTNFLVSCGVVHNGKLASKTMVVPRDSIELFGVLEQPNPDGVLIEGIDECAACGLRDQKLRTCSACLVTSYCGAACQKAHWRDHKLKCREMKKSISRLMT